MYILFYSYFDGLGQKFGKKFILVMYVCNYLYFSKF